eukprot:2982405-Rhodomonas_salina.1
MTSKGAPSFTNGRMKKLVNLAQTMTNSVLKRVYDKMLRVSVVKALQCEHDGKGGRHHATRPDQLQHLDDGADSSDETFGANSRCEQAQGTVGLHHRPPGIIPLLIPLLCSPTLTLLLSSSDLTTSAQINHNGLAMSNIASSRHVRCTPVLGKLARAVRLRVLPTSY